MFTYRQLLIISFLLSESPSLPIEVLSTVLGVSKRTIQKEVKEINELLPEKEQFLISAKEEGYKRKLSPQTLAWLNQLVREEKEQPLEQIKRRDLILLVLLFEADYLSMEELSRRLYVSKSMIHKEMEQHWKLREFIDVSSQKGLIIRQSEVVKRNLAAKLFHQHSYLNELLMLPEDTPHIFQQVKKLTDRLFLAHAYYISGKSLALFQNYLVMTIIRNKQGFYLPEIQDVSFEQSSLLSEIITELKIDFSKTDRFYLQAKLNELNVASFTGEVEEFPDYFVFNQVLERFLAVVEEMFHMNLELTPQWKKKFFLHMHKLKIRIANGNDNNNYLKRKIHQEYPLTTLLVRDYLIPLFEMELPESEITYIVLYFAEMLEENQDECRILFITDNLPSVIYHTEEQIKKYSGFKIHSIKTLSVYDYLQNSEKYTQTEYVLLTTSQKVILETNQAFLIKDLNRHTDFQLLHHYFDLLVRNQKKKSRMKFQKQYLATAEIKKISPQQFEEYKKSYQAFKTELVIEEPIIFMPSLITSGPCQLMIYQLEKKYKHRGHQIEYMVISQFNPAMEKSGFYYRELKNILSVKELKKLF